MSLQRRMELITGLCVWLLAGLSVASPPPRLGWSKATLLTDPIAGVGPVRFELECPGGKLSPCSPRRGFKATVPMAKRKKLNLPDVCSGAGTSLAMTYEDFSTLPISIQLGVPMSSEYMKQDLTLSLDLRSGKFTRAEAYSGAGPGARAPEGHNWGGSRALSD